MKSQKIILIFEIILCILVGIGMFLISHFIYADAFRINFVISLLTSWIVITLIDWKKEINTVQPKVRWFTVLLIIITIAGFIAYKPDFSYREGKGIVVQHGYKNLSEVQNKSIISFGLKNTRLVPNAYLYTGEKNNVKYYILLSPIDGKIEIKKIGDGNYLDEYFEMK